MSRPTTEARIWRPLTSSDDWTAHSDEQPANDAGTPRPPALGAAIVPRTQGHRLPARSILRSGDRGAGLDDPGVHPAGGLIGIGGGFGGLYRPSQGRDHLVVDSLFVGLGQQDRKSTRLNSSH